MYVGAPTAAHGFVPWDPHTRTAPVRPADLDDPWEPAPDPRAWPAAPSLPPPPDREEAGAPDGADWLSTGLLVLASALCSFAVGAVSAVSFFLLGVWVA